MCRSLYLIKNTNVRIHRKNERISSPVLAALLGDATQHNRFQYDLAVLDGVR